MATATVQELHGKYYVQNARARIYTGSGASTGIAILLPATGGGHPTLWNPSDSGRYLSIVRLELARVTGNNAPGAMEWAAVTNTGAAVGTGSPIATATLVAPTGILGATVDNKGRWSPTTNTFTAAPVFLRTAGITLATAVAASVHAPYVLRVDYDGDFVIGPGTAISLCYQTTTTTSTFQVSVTWEEATV